MSHHIAILGGGIAGLTAASTLKRLDPAVEVTVFEASSRTGGKIGSAREQGFLTEDGPNTVLDRDGTLRALAGQAKVEPLAVSSAGRRRFVYLRDQLLAAPSGPGSLVTSKMMSTRAKLRMLAEPFLAEPRPAGDESVQSFTTRHFGAEAGTLLARVMARGVFAGDETRLSVRSAMPKLARLDSGHRSIVAGALFGPKPAARVPRFMGSFRGGLGELTGALAGQLNGSVRAASPIELLQPRGKQWRVAWGGASAGEALFDGVVMALPSNVGGQLLARTGTAAGEAAADALLGTAYAAVNIVHLGYRRDALGHDLNGFGVIGADDTLGPLGILFPSSLFPERAPEGHALLTVLMGGVRHPEVAARADADLVAEAHQAVRRILGAKDEPVYSRLVRHGAAIPQYGLGHSERIATAEQALEQLPPIALAGAGYHGVGVSEAIASGLRAAERFARPG